MLAAILAAVVVASATPSPVPSAPSGPLRTIITVKSSTFCSQFADELNPAIGSAVSNDTSLGTLVMTLKSRGLAGSVMDREHEMQHLVQLADSIYKNYRAGEVQVNELRALEQRETNPIEQAEIKAAADALGGALYRQHLVQRDLDGFVAYLDAAEMRRGTDDDLMSDPSIVPEPRFRDGPQGTAIISSPPTFTQGLPGDESADQDAKWASEAADDFLTRLPSIRNDEAGAATYIDAVWQHC